MLEATLGSHSVVILESFCGVLQTRALVSDSNSSLNSNELDSKSKRKLDRGVELKLGFGPQD